MEMFAKLIVFVMAFVTLTIGTLVTFSYVKGISDPLEFFSKIQMPADMYMIAGLIVLAIVIIVGALIFLKERIMGYT
jgi:hypothetical protein